MIRESKAEKVRSDRSRDRFEAREARLEQEAIAREAQRAARRAAAEKKAAAGGADDPVAAAIARAKAKKESAGNEESGS
tara:strand:- start:385 stop:621 length:237 start_codon:yes stop_codon:yes gene_type:complete